MFLAGQTPRTADGVRHLDAPCALPRWPSRGSGVAAYVPGRNVARVSRFTPASSSVS